MAQRALRLGFDRVIVDTSGLVQGELGRLLKQHKIDLVEPELVLCLQRNGECEHILRPYGTGDRPAVPAPGALGRDPAAVAGRAPPAPRAEPPGLLRRRAAISLDLSRVILPASPPCTSARRSRPGRSKTWRPWWTTWSCGRSGGGPSCSS